MGEPRVCVKGLRAPLMAAAARTGRPLPELAKKVGIELMSLGDPALRVPHSQVVQVWDAMAALAGDESFGLFAAELVGAAPFDLVDLALAHSPNLGAMARSFLRYQTLFHEGHDSVLERRGSRNALIHRLRGELPRSRHLTEFILAVWLVKGRRAVATDYPVEVSFRHPAPADDGAHRRLFGTVRFAAAEDAILSELGVHDLPVKTANPQLFETLAPQLDHEIQASGGEAAFLNEVRMQVRKRLPEGDAMVGEVAQALAMSERTLQRRLRDAGLSFRAVVDEVRREVALAQLGKSTATVTDIAFMLGFSDLSAFSRAFRRWTGANPAAYRAGG